MPADGPPHWSRSTVLGLTELPEDPKTYFDLPAGSGTVIVSMWPALRSSTEPTTALGYAARTSAFVLPTLTMATLFVPTRAI